MGVDKKSTLDRKHTIMHDTISHMLSVRVVQGCLADVAALQLTPDVIHSTDVVKKACELVENFVNEARLRKKCVLAALNIIAYDSELPSETRAAIASLIEPRVGPMIDALLP